jgi:hypothetical protein
MSEEHHVRRVHTEDAVLNIGGDIGALILYTGPEFLEAEIEISPVDDDRGRVHTAVHERRVGDRTVYAGIYPELRAGDYRVWADDPGLPDRVTIVGGEVTKLDWRRGPERQSENPEPGGR